MTNLLLKVEEQLTTLDECDKFLAIFSEFIYDEGVDTIEQNAVGVACFLRRLPIYLPLITVVRDKIIEVKKILDAVVDTGFEAVREKNAAKNEKGVCV